jgi:hypothetical protein
MSWLTDWWNSIVQSDNQEIINKYEIKIKAYQENVDVLNERILELTDNYKNASNTIQALTLEKAKLLGQIKELISPDTKEKELESYWNTKYLRAIMEYNCRTLPGSSVMIAIPVNVLITPNDPFIIKDLKEWELYRMGEDSETLIPKIYKKIFEKYNYKIDSIVWGLSEFWEFVFEMRAKAKLNNNKWEFDCDSWADLIASYLICAGVPRWRVRVVAGDTSIGGHSTIYCYSMVDNNWHHINSTYFNGMYDKLSMYYTHEDAKSPTNPKGTDGIGIYNVWYSFNDLYCWYKFETDLPKEINIIK